MHDEFIYNAFPRIFFIVVCVIIVVKESITEKFFFRKKYQQRIMDTHQNIHAFCIF